MPEIELFYSCRGDELELIREMTDINVRVFDSTASVESPATELRRFHQRRLRAADFDVPTLEQATVFLCGPDGFMADVRSWLESRLEPAQLRFESFDF